MYALQKHNVGRFTKGLSAGCKGFSTEKFKDTVSDIVPEFERTRK